MAGKIFCGSDTYKFFKAEFFVPMSLRWLCDFMFGEVFLICMEEVGILE